MVAARDHIIGRSLGDFVVREQLGEGGFGAVYRAEQTTLQREAVVKVLRRELRAKEVVIQRFLREARLASQLDHPYAAHVYAFGVEDDGLMWIAMELVRGTPLDKLLRAQGPMPLDRLIQLMDRLCEVAHTAHEQGIVHRDIKPANVIVIARAGRMLPKLLDFGIAKIAAPATSLEGPAPRASAPQIPSDANDAFDATAVADAPDETVPDVSESDSGELTQRGAIVGSPRYMAPEQWVDASAADARADVYALGVLAYEALTGKPPFDGRSVLEIAMAHAHQPAPVVGAGFPAALDAVFARALAKDPEQRYPTALDLAIALREASGIAESREVLPQLDEVQRDALIADAPQPLAEAVALLGAATNAHQARDAIGAIVRLAVRWIGILALACRSRLGTANGRDTEQVREALRTLRRRAPSDHEWLELARELCRPYATQPDVFPIPELVTLFFDHTGERAGPLDGSLAAFSTSQHVTEEQVRDGLARAVPELTQLLRALAFVADYPVVVRREDRAELWMGLRRPKRRALSTIGPPLESGRPTLVDRDGRPVLVLWPLAQVWEPSPGAAQELFLFEGSGRHGARYIAHPQQFERQDEALWSWFGEALVDTLDEVAGPKSAESPYRGLAAFTADDAAMFFGREREVEAFVNRLHALPMIAVVGPSGAGKSSFVQAGVVPSLPANWRALAIRPGASPMSALEVRLAQDGLVADGQASLAEALRAHARATGTLVIVVDQFEEVFTLCRDPDERVRFAEVLVGAARSVEDPVRVIFTLRDDFLLHAEQLAPLRARLAVGIQLLSTPARHDLLRIVVEPARRAGYDFEDRELAQQMVDEVADQPGALALLSFAASRLWERRDRHFKQLGRRAYDAMGGVGGALAQHAEATLSECSAEDQRLVREAFRHLVTAEGTRAVLTRTELLQVLGGGARAEAVIERLVVARLLVTSEGEGGVERVEVIHEALLAAWPRLVGWRREDAEGARLRDQLRVAARQWEERGRPRGLLWRDEALAEYQLWRARHPGALTASETDFAAASLGDARRARRARRLVLVVTFVALTAGLAVLYRTNQETRRQRAFAEQQGAVARRNAETAQQRLVELYAEQGRIATLAEDPMRALVYLEQAQRAGARDPAQELLIAWNAQRLSGQLVWLREPSSVLAVALSGDGRIAATARRDGGVGLWDVDSGRRLHELAAHAKRVRLAHFSTDARRLVTADAGAVKVWDVTTGEPLRSIEHGEETSAIAADDHVIVTGDARGGARLWDVRTGAALAALTGHAATISDAALAGPHAATSDERGIVRVWRIPEGRAIATLEAHRGEVRRVRFGPGGKLLASTGWEDGFARVWDATTGRRLAEIKHRAPQVRAVAFDPAGERVITGGDDRVVRISSARSGEELVTIETETEPLLARFLPDGRRVLTTHFDGSVKLWDAETGAPIWSFLGHGEGVWDAQIDGTGARILTGSLDGTAGVWDANQSGHRALPGHVGDVLSSEYSRDGTQIVTTADDGRVRLWSRDGTLLRSFVVAGSKHATFDHDGGRLAIATGRGASVYATGTGELVYEIAEEGAIRVAYDPTGRHLAVVSHDRGTLRIFDARSGALVRAFPPYEEGLWYVAYSRDGTTLATAGRRGALVLWDPATGQVRRRLDHGQTGVTSIAFSRDGRRLVTGSEDRLARIWDLESGTLVAQLEGHGSAVSSVDLSPDGLFVLTASHDGTVRIWDVASARQLATVGARTIGYFSARYSPDATEIVVTSVGDAGVWRQPSTRLANADLQLLVACKIPKRLHAPDTRYPPCDEKKLRR